MKKKLKPTKQSAHEKFMKRLFEARVQGRPKFQGGIFKIDSMPPTDEAIEWAKQEIKKYEEKVGIGPDYVKIAERVIVEKKELLDRLKDA